MSNKTYYVTGLIECNVDTSSNFRTWTHDTDIVIMLPEVNGYSIHNFNNSDLAKHSWMPSHAVVYYRNSNTVTNVKMGLVGIAYYVHPTDGSTPRLCLTNKTGLDITNEYYIQFMYCGDTNKMTTF